MHVRHSVSKPCFTEWNPLVWIPILELYKLFLDFIILD